MWGRWTRRSAASGGGAPRHTPLRTRPPRGFHVDEVDPGLSRAGFALTGSAACPDPDDGGGARIGGRVGRSYIAYEMPTNTEHRTSQHDSSTPTPAGFEDSNSVKDEFLGLVSHELRTPVTTILGNARLLQDRRDQLAAEQRDSMLADIAAEAERLHEIIENLLSLTRLGTDTRPELEPTALDRVIQRSVAQVQRRYPDHPIVFSSRPSVIVDADRTYLELLVENLVGNAAKYSPDDSPIDVLVEESDDEVRVLVLDRGIGLDEQPGADLFEPFYRGERARSTAGGVGIGLAVCRRIVHLLGGRIWARSRDEGGAEFGFALPIAPDVDDMPLRPL
jgi:K+-sensing histidine kinase KdpD